MWLDSESQETIDNFWEMAGGQEAFPRALERSLSIALPVALVKLPHLDLRTIENYLSRRNVRYSFDCENREVRGCLVGFGGKGVIFVDGTDTPEEMRVTIAHEIAHYLTDYHQPRTKASMKYGVSILEVFDGLREPSLDERVYSVLSGISIGMYADLMDRSNSLDLDTTWSVENRADKIALALLAPPDSVLGMADLSGKLFQIRRDEIVSILRSSFGLPSYIALSYGSDLLRSIGKGPSWSESIRFIV
jgi:hypothetical protein